MTGKRTQDRRNDAGAGRVSRLALVLALVAIVLRIGSPGWAATVSGESATGTRTITICVGAGFQTITIDAEGQRTAAPASAPAPHNQHHDCLSCCMRLANAALSSPVHMPARSAHAARLSLPTADQPWLSVEASLRQARGPPAV